MGRRANGILRTRLRAEDPLAEVGVEVSFSFLQAVSVRKARVAPPSHFPIAAAQPMGGRGTQPQGSLVPACCARCLPSLSAAGRSREARPVWKI